MKFVGLEECEVIPRMGEIAAILWWTSRVGLRKLLYEALGEVRTDEAEDVVVVEEVMAPELLRGDRL